MKVKLLTLILCLMFSHQALAQDVNLHQELSPNIDNSDQVEVRTYKHDDDNSTITEYRSGGRVWMIKVQPSGDFPPYYLYDDEGTGNFQRRIAGNEQPTPPMWIIKRF